MLSTVPLSWYPRLLYGTEKERENFRLIGNGDTPLIHNNWNSTKLKYTFKKLLLEFNKVEKESIGRIWMIHLLLTTIGTRRSREDISIKGLLSGHRSGKSQKSLKKWLDSRKV